jgi:hypothetical protein
MSGFGIFTVETLWSGCEVDFEELLAGNWQMVRS